MISNIEDEKHKWNFSSLRKSLKDNRGTVESQVNASSKRFETHIWFLGQNSKRCIQIAVIKSFRSYKSRLNFMLCCASRSSHIWFYNWHSVVCSSLSSSSFQHGTNRKKTFHGRNAWQFRKLHLQPPKTAEPGKGSFHNCGNLWHVYIWNSVTINDMLCCSREKRNHSKVELVSRVKRRHH